MIVFETVTTFERIRLLLVEDHISVREGLRQVLERERDLWVVGEAGTCQEALDLAVALKPHVMLLDQTLPDDDGLSVLERLSQRGALSPTLVFSGGDERIYARRALRAGARGYLTKGVGARCLVQAIRSIHAGQLVASPTITTQLMQEALAQLGQGSDPGEMSERERQVFGLLARCLSQKEVAVRLGLSSKTVSTYKVRLMKKLGATTEAQLTEWFRAVPLAASDRAPKNELLWDI